LPQLTQKACITASIEAMIFQFLHQLKQKYFNFSHQLTEKACITASIEAKVFQFFASIEAKVCRFFALNEAKKIQIVSSIEAISFLMNSC